MAPWRVAKPRNLQQLPRFLSYEPGSGEEREGPAAYRIRRGAGHHVRHRPRRAGRLCAALAPQGRAGARAQALHRRDRSAARQPGRSARSELGGARFQGLGATGALHAARRHADARQHLEPARRRGDGCRRVEGRMDLARQAARAAPARPCGARHLARRRGGGADRGDAEIEEPASRAYKPSDIGVIEMSESSAAQAIALVRSLELDEDMLNPDGGAIARGHPFAAAELRSRHAPVHAHGARRERRPRPRHRHARRRRRHGHRGIVRSRLAEALLHH